MNPELLNQIRATLAAVLVTLAGITDTLDRERLRVDVPAGANLQAYMDVAQDGATLLLAAGATYQGHWICRKPLTLTTQGVTVAPGIRATVAESGTLAILRSPDKLAAYTAAPGSRGCQLLAIEVAANGDPAGTAVMIGVGNETALDQYPVDPVLRHVLVRGDPVTGLKRCVSLHAINATVEGSHISGCRIPGQDSQAIWAQGPGPYRIVNNYLEAASENALFGGDRVLIQGLVPSDILIEGNTFAKPLEWKSLKGWVVKNLLEFKNARRVVIRGNVFDGSWVDGQVGYAVLFTPKNQYGDNPWTTVEDVLFERNVIRNASNGINIYGAFGGVDSDGKPAKRMSGLVVRDNLLTIDTKMMGGDGRCLMIGGGPVGLTVERNTCDTTGATTIYTYGPATAQVERATFRSNIWRQNRYGFSGGLSGLTGNTLGTLVTYYPGVVWEGNAVIGATAKQYPAGTLIVPLADAGADALVGVGVDRSLLPVVP